MEFLLIQVLAGLLVMSMTNEPTTLTEEQVLSRAYQCRDDGGVQRMNIKAVVCKSGVKFKFED